MAALTFGPPRYYRPVCVQREHGFYAGPIGYEESTADEAAKGPIKVCPQEETDV